jgi:N-acetylglucosamine-6-sulfatase
VKQSPQTQPVAKRFTKHERIEMTKIIALLVSSVTGLLLASVVVLLEEEQRIQAQTRPNIVFILTDDQHESTLRYMPNVQNLLRGQGRTFNNATTVYPLCCPSRATIQRGQYAHNTGIFGNEPDTGGGYELFDQLDLEKSTVATWLDAAGYYTIYMGKYMNGFGPAYEPPPGWDKFNVPTSSGQQGETLDATRAIRAMAHVRDAAPRMEPFFLQVGFSTPHVPNIYESKYEGMFTGEQVPRVPSFDEQDVSDKPRYIREDKPLLAQQTNPQVHEQCRDNEVNSIQQNDCEYVRQLRSLQTVDRFVKDLVNYLATQGELSNTYIVFYTDNGNHWGEHRLDYGKLTPYETDISFPMYVRGPHIPPNTSSRKLVGNHDIAPTFAQIAGASTPSFVDGRSFLRIADDDPTNNSPWRTGLYVERRRNPGLPSKESDYYVPPWQAVREENSIYVLYSDDPWTKVNDSGYEEFYNLSTDPHELRNLAHYDEIARATLDRLSGRVTRLSTCKGSACQTAENEAIQ